MKALTLWQPWATLVAIGAKPYEFRSWPPPQGLVWQRLAIHAAARPIKLREIEGLVAAIKGKGTNPCLRPEIALPALEQLQAALRNPDGTLFGSPEAAHFPLSHIVCTVTVGAAKHGARCAAEFGIELSPQNGDRFNVGWPMLKIEPLKPPQPAKGAQGLWNWKGL